MFRALFFWCDFYMAAFAFRPVAFAEGTRCGKKKQVWRPLTKKAQEDGKHRPDVTFDVRNDNKSLLTCKAGPLHS